MKQAFSLFPRMIEVLGAALLALMISAWPAQAQSSDTMAPLDSLDWQAVISQQLDAFRSNDAEGALEMAGFMFKQQYADPQRFMHDVLSWGYEPILHSQSHSFGDYQPVGPNSVLQVVQVIGSDQGYYQAIYQLSYEADGWRIQGVSMSQKQGVGI